MSDGLFPDPRLIDLLRSMNQGMPPWEAYRWFDTPLERVVALPFGAGWVQLCERSVRRVCLIFACPPTASGQISLNQGSANSGIGVQAGQSPLILTQQQHGPLCQEPWFGSSGGGSFITVVEVLLRAWPGGDPIG